MGQEDKAEKKTKATSAQGWNRKRMNKTHRKGKKKAKEVTASARRNYSKAVVGGALKSESPPPIAPFDRERCQAEITTGVSLKNFMTMGGSIAKTERCSNKPTVIVMETKAGEDGERGHMTLCEGCLAVLKKQIPVWRENIEVTDL